MEILWRQTSCNHHHVRSKHVYTVVCSRNSSLWNVFYVNGTPAVNSCLVGRHDCPVERVLLLVVDDLVRWSCCGPRGGGGHGWHVFGNRSKTLYRWSVPRPSFPSPNCDWLLVAMIEIVLCSGRISVVDRLQVLESLGSFHGNAVVFHLVVIRALSLEGR